MTQPVHAQRYPHQIKLDGVEYLIMKEEDVLAIEDAGSATNNRPFSGATSASL